jgi:Mg2+ and Co2+ transporter CorA
MSEIEDINKEIEELRQKLAKAQNYLIELDRDDAENKAIRLELSDIIEELTLMVHKLEQKKKRIFGSE